MYLDDESAYRSLPRSIRAAISNLIWFGYFPYGNWRLCSNNISNNNIESKLAKFELNSLLWKKTDKGWFLDQKYAFYNCHIGSNIKCNRPYIHINISKIGFYAKLINLALMKEHEIKIKFSDIHLMAKSQENLTKVTEALNNLSIFMAVLIKPEYLELVTKKINDPLRLKVTPIWHCSLDGKGYSWTIARKIQNYVKLFCVEHKSVFPLQVKSELSNIFCEY